MSGFSIEEPGVPFLFINTLYKKTIMKKKLLTVLMAMCAAAASAWAGNGVWVERLDDTKQGFLFTDKPVITYTAESLVMTTEKATAEFPFADVKRLSFDGDITVVSVAEAKTDSRLISVTADGAELSGFEAGTAVLVYDVMGHLVATCKTAADGALSISLAGYPTGVYIIKAEKSTLKIQNK